MRYGLPDLKHSRSRRLALCIVACAVAVLLGIGYYWCRKHRAAVGLRDAYEGCVAQYELHQVRPIDVCVASEDVCLAEREVPFADAIRAEALHVVRLHRIEAKTRAAIPVTMFGSQEAHDAALDELGKIVAMRIAAEQRLDELCHGE